MFGTNKLMCAHKCKCYDCQCVCVLTNIESSVQSGYSCHTGQMDRETRNQTVKR